LMEQRVHERCLAMVDMRDDGDVSDILDSLHWITIMTRRFLIPLFLVTATIACAISREAESGRTR
jgi:hypothetical protein